MSVAIIIASGAIVVNALWRISTGRLLSFFEIAVSNVCFVVCIAVIAMVLLFGP